MSIKRITAITVASLAWIGTFGLLGEAESNAATMVPTAAYAVYPDRDADQYARWNVCEQGTIGYRTPVFITSDFIVFGDQDENGYIDGDDCNWR